MTQTAPPRPSADEADTRVDVALQHLLDGHPPAACQDEAFWAAQFDLGLAWVHFPAGLGGLGIDAAHQATVHQRIRSAGGSAANWERNVVGVGMAAPTLLAYASRSEQRHLLRRIFTCEDIWCQLFSEPGAGSDLANVATSAVEADGTWRVNGQKVWTTLAHQARWGLLLARTDPDVPKHKGLTYFFVDMRSPGIEVRPLFELTGEAEFNEVFLTDVEVPDSNRLGPIGEGWTVASTTLNNERAAAGHGLVEADGDVIRFLEQAWRSRATANAVGRDNFVRLWIRARILQLNGIRMAQAATRESGPGPESSITKLQWAELNQAAANFAVDLSGSVGMLHDEGYPFRRPSASALHSASPSKALLRSRANTIEGGTSEIMRNVIGERHLGLPREPRADRGMPWRQVPRV